MKTKYLNVFDPLKDEKLSLMDKDGNILNKELWPDIDDNKILEAYKLMSLSRIQDTYQNKMQRQGRLLSFLSSTGQEACEVAYAMNLRKGKDWFLSGYRNNAGWLTMGVPIRNIMLYWAGNERGGKSPDGVNVLPPNIVIGSQYSQAAGIAFANKYKKIDSVVATTTGDGGTSEGETYEAMNFAAVHGVPCIFICENNKWAISTPTREQTVAKNFALKSFGAGVPSIIVDGNDFVASYAVMEEATKYVKEHGPVFIDFETYRLGAHSSSDSPDVYRPKEEFEVAKQFCPLVRLKKYLISKNIWSEEKQAAFEEEQLKLIASEFEWVEKNKNYEVDEIFDYQYEKKDLFLEEQIKEAKAFLKKYPVKEEE